MKDMLMKELADNMVNNVLKIQKNDKVLIRGHLITNKMISVISKEVEKCGGTSSFDLIDKELYNKAMTMDSLDSYELIVNDIFNRIEASDAIINLFSEEDDFDREQISVENALKIQKMNNRYITHMMHNKKWLYFKYPTSEVALKADMSESDFDEMVMQAASFDFEPWQEALEYLKNRITKAKSIHIRNDNTDIRFKKNGIGAVISTGKNYLPDGEIYTAPVKDSVNGHVRFNTTLNFLGHQFHNVRLTFKNGKVVGYSCEGDQEKLGQILKMDDGASYIGKFAFGINPVLKTPIGNTLYDEKIYGSIHLALGNSSNDEADNGNRSDIQWMLIMMLKATVGSSEVYLDGRLFQKDGVFVERKLEHQF